jgi:hypothetical protein
MGCCESCDSDEIAETIVTLLPSVATNTYRPTSTRKSIGRSIFFISTLLACLACLACLAPITLLIFNSRDLEKDKHLAKFENSCKNSLTLCRNFDLTVKLGQNPPRRREWSLLGEEEQEDLTTAIQCLTQMTSKLGLPTTPYNDFVYVHIEIYTAGKKNRGPYHQSE